MPPKKKPPALPHADGQEETGAETCREEPTKNPLLDQAHETTHLISRYSRLRSWLNCCPSSRVLSGFSLTLSKTVFIQLRCKRWGCCHCGPRKISHYSRRVADARPTKFVTLTVANGLYSSPRAAYDETRRKVSDLTRLIRKQLDEWEYFRVLEATKKGWPHYHLVVRGGWIDQQKLSAMWKELTGARIVDIRAIKNPLHAYRYVMKYLGKQKYVPWTDRRCTWTRNFFVDDGFKPADSLNLESIEFHNMSPCDFFYYEMKGAKLERMTSDAWCNAVAPR